MAVYAAALVADPSQPPYSGDDLIFVPLTGSVFLMGDRGIVLHLSQFLHHFASTSDNVKSQHPFMKVDWYTLANVHVHIC